MQLICLSLFLRYYVPFFVSLIGTIISSTNNVVSACVEIMCNNVHGDNVCCCVCQSPGGHVLSGLRVRSPTSSEPAVLQRYFIR